MHADWVSEGVSPKARRNIPRAPLMSRSTRIPSELWIQRWPPSLATISPFQLQVLEVYASLTRRTCLPVSQAFHRRNCWKR